MLILEILKKRLLIRRNPRPNWWARVVWMCYMLILLDFTLWRKGGSVPSFPKSRNQCKAAAAKYLLRHASAHDTCRKKAQIRPIRSGCSSLSDGGGGTSFSPGKVLKSDACTLTVCTTLYSVQWWSRTTVKLGSAGKLTSMRPRAAMLCLH